MFLRAKLSVFRLFFVSLRTVATSFIRRRCPFFRHFEISSSNGRRNDFWRWRIVLPYCYCVLCFAIPFSPSTQSPWYVANADATTIQVKMCSVVTVLFAILFLVLLLLLVLFNRFLVPSFYCTEEHLLFSSIVLVVAAESTSKYFRI